MKVKTELIQTLLLWKVKSARHKSEFFEYFGRSANFVIGKWCFNNLMLHSLWDNFQWHKEQYWMMCQKECNMRLIKHLLNDSQMELLIDYSSFCAKYETQICQFWEMMNSHKTRIPGVKHFLMGNNSVD